MQGEMLVYAGGCLYMQGGFLYMQEVLVNDLQRGNKAYMLGPKTENGIQCSGFGQNTENGQRETENDTSPVRKRKTENGKRKTTRPQSCCRLIQLGLRLSSREG